MGKFYITGVSGTGKSTLVQELVNRGIAAFDMDLIAGLCHWRNKVHPVTTGRPMLSGQGRRRNSKSQREAPAFRPGCNGVHGGGADYQPGIGRDWLDAHDYICDPVKLEELIGGHSDSNIVVAGLASNQDNFLNLFDKIFLLHCSEKTFIARLDDRNNNGFAKDKTEQEHILSWYKDFEDKMLRRGAVPINAENSTAAMADEIISEMSG